MVNIYNVFTTENQPIRPGHSHEEHLSHFGDKDDCRVVDELSAFSQKADNSNSMTDIL